MYVNVFMGVSKKTRAFFRSPCNKNPGILASISGAPDFWRRSNDMAKMAAFVNRGSFKRGFWLR